MLTNIDVNTTLVVLYATDTMADWEYGYAVAGLGMSPAIRLVVAAESTEEVVTMGGLRLRPEASLAELDAEQIGLLIMPGADTWAEGHDEVLALATQLEQQGTPVAAICGATLGLARAGLLNERRHTSNAPDFLGMTESYTGGSHYSDAAAVADAGVITAGATAPIDFARAIFEALGALPQPVIDAWYGLYTTGERKYYDQLVGAA